MFQFFHNEYRNSGVQMSTDICKVEKANIFSLKQQFEDAQFDLSLCDMKKVGTIGSFN